MNLARLKSTLWAQELLINYTSNDADTLGVLTQTMDKTAGTHALNVLSSYSEIIIILDLTLHLF